MDTGTHLVMGITLGGLATIDPVVFSSSPTAQSVLIAAVIGSQIPDIDTVLKLKNNADYIRHHRGITHSAPAILLWPVFILVFLYPFFPDANLFHLWIWTFLAVFLHVFVDIFNAYGTQALRPFSHKWVALGWINTFDSILFALHVFGIAGWFFGLDPRILFPVLYSFIACYYFYRYFLKRSLQQRIKRRIPDAEKIIISPTVKFFQWRAAVITKDKFYVAKGCRKDLVILDEFKRIPLPDNPIMNAAKKDKNISVFLSFSPVYRWEMTEGDSHYEVRFIDLRYRSKDHYPFVAVVLMDRNLNIFSSYTGWIFNKEKLRKKFEVIPG